MKKPTPTKKELASPLTSVDRHNIEILASAKYGELLFDPPSIYEIPEHKLMHAILIQAWREATKTAHQNSQLFARQAYLWFSSTNTHTFSFLNICLHLELDPSKIKKILDSQIFH